MSIIHQGFLMKLIYFPMLAICFCIFVVGCGEKESEFFLATEKPSWWKDVSEFPDCWGEVIVSKPKGTTPEEEIEYILFGKWSELRTDETTDRRKLIKSCSEFLERNPKVPIELRAKAQFVIANQYNVLGDYKRSIKEYWKYYENFALLDLPTNTGLEPRGHAALTLFSIGANFSELGDKEHAKRSFMECYRKYPNLHWGKRAKEEYEKIK